MLDDKKTINDLCVICYDNIGYKILCTKCKLKYCDICSYNIQNKCCICYRIKLNNINNNNGIITYIFYTILIFFSFLYIPLLIISSFIICYLITITIFAVLYFYIFIFIIQCINFFIYILSWIL